MLTAARAIELSCDAAWRCFHVPRPSGVPDRARAAVLQVDLEDGSGGRLEVGAVIREADAVGAGRAGNRGGADGRVLGPAAQVAPPRERARLRPEALSAGLVGVAPLPRLAAIPRGAARRQAVVGRLRLQLARAAEAVGVAQVERKGVGVTGLGSGRAAGRGGEDCRQQQRRAARRWHLSSWLETESKRGRQGQREKSRVEDRVIRVPG